MSPNKVLDAEYSAVDGESSDRGRRGTAQNVRDNVGGARDVPQIRTEL